MLVEVNTTMVAVVFLVPFDGLVFVAVAVSVRAFVCVALLVSVGLTNIRDGVGVAVGDRAIAVGRGAVSVGASTTAWGAVAKTVGVLCVAPVIIKVVPKMTMMKTLVEPRLSQSRRGDSFRVGDAIPGGGSVTALSS